MQSALFPALVLAVVVYVVGSKMLVRRRLSKLHVSGGRMALVLNLMDRRTR
jgi:hypothetical protein